jgi:hypothetical protein
MRHIYAVMALTLMVACGGDGKDGRDGAPGPQGAAGPPGADGQDGDDGAPGTNGKDGTNGTNGADGDDGADGSDGADGADGSAILQGSGAPAASLGADGDIYIDTVSRDVYEKSNGAWAVIVNLSGGPPGPKGDPGDDGMPGADGTGILTGSGAPAAGLGNVGDVYVDSVSGNLYSKGAGGWTLTGNLKGPAGDDGAPGTDGADGVDVKDTVGGVRWFAFALDAAFADATSTLLTSQAHTASSSTATFGFTNASQHGRLAFHTSGSFVQGGVNWVAFDYLTVSAAVTGGAVSAVRLILTNGDNVFCQWNSTTAAGPNYTFDLWAPSSCTNESAAAEDFSLVSVTDVQIGIQSSGAGSRTLTITDIDLVPN